MNNMMRLVPNSSQAIVSRYSDHMRVRNLRPWTIYGRQRALGRLAAWADAPLLQLTETDLYAWQVERSRQVAAESLRGEMSHHRAFYGWCVRERILDVDPTVRLDLPRVARRLPRPIGDDRLAEAMLTAPDDVRVCLALAAMAGLRACEIAGLDWSEVGTGKQRTLRVAEGKGGHGRLVPLSTSLAAELDALPHHRGPVVRRRDGQPGRCQSHRISHMCNGHLHGLGIDETLHQLRHRFATTAYRACRDIRAVQEMLGHASPTTTAIYAAAASDVALGAVEAAGRIAA